MVGSAGVPLAIELSFSPSSCEMIEENKMECKITAAAAAAVFVSWSNEKIIHAPHD